MTGIEKKSWTEKASTEKKKKKQTRGQRKAKEPTRLAAQPATTTPTAVKVESPDPTPSTTRTSSRTLAPDVPSFIPREQAAADPSPRGTAVPFGNNISIPTGPRTTRINWQHRSQGQLDKFPNGSANRKRKLQDWETSQSRNGGSERTADNSNVERPRKQVARGGGGTLGRSGQLTKTPTSTVSSFGLSSTAAPFIPNMFGQQLQSAPRLSIPDPMEAFNFFANMSTMMGMGFPNLGFGAQDNPKPRCPDYETKGICKLGTFCLYDHGEAVIVPAAPEYDPTYTSFQAKPHSNGHQTANGHEGRFFGTKRHEGNQVLFSPTGPSHGRDDTVVVEQIPKDCFTEERVREFFGQFGAIVDVQMHAGKRLSIVKFSDHLAAQRAYDSPKVVFENRFVKVYWYKPEQLPQTNGMARHKSVQSDIPEIYNEDGDIEARMLDEQFMARQEKIDELEARITETRRAIGVKMLEKKHLQEPITLDSLYKLQAEAQSLYEKSERAKAERATASGAGFSNGREPSFVGRVGGVVRLDNRPRRLAVGGVESGSAKERALKQHLLNAKGCSGVRPHAERADTLVVGFEQRYQAEVVRD